MSVTTPRTDGEHTRRLAEWVSRLDAAELPADVVATYRSLLLDTLACALAGSGTDLGDQLAAVATALGPGPCTLVGRSATASPFGAALYNGGVSHSLNWSALGPGTAHVGAVLLGGLLAAVEQQPAVSGARLLAALVAAGETTTRLAEAVAATPEGPHLKHRWLLGQLLGYVGVAAGCARLLELDAERTHSAIGLAVMQAAGTMEVLRLGDVPAKGAYAAFPNATGLTAALLAKAGLDAGFQAVEGEHGLFGLQLGLAAPAPDRLDDVEIRSAAAHIKRWPVSVNVERFLAAAAQAGLAAVAATRPVASVLVSTSEADRPWLEPAAARQRPANAAGAANSIAFSLAGLLQHGDVPAGRPAEARLADEAVLALAARVTHTLIAQGGRRMIIRFADGEECAVEVPDDPGAAGNSPDAVEAKLRRCAALAAEPPSARAVDALVAGVRELPDLPDVRPLLALARGAHLRPGHDRPQEEPNR
jgi:2-methylcitrate dehydratase PrpD